jgi:hypothetical protein
MVEVVRRYHVLAFGHFVISRYGDFSPTVVSGVQNRLLLQPTKSGAAITKRGHFAIVGER